MFTMPYACSGMPGPTLALFLHSDFFHGAIKTNLVWARDAVVANSGDDFLDDPFDAAQVFRQKTSAGIKIVEVRVDQVGAGGAFDSGRVDDQSLEGERRQLVVDRAVVGLPEIGLEDLLDGGDTDGFFVRLKVVERKGLTQTGWRQWRRWCTVEECF